MSFNIQGQENKLQPSLTDTDIMPWGKYKDECLQDIPASYFRWLWEDGETKLWKGSKVEVFKTKLANYIWNSRNALNQELGEQAIT
jgi:uncharacterized protein (DUF3820 family)